MAEALALIRVMLFWVVSLNDFAEPFEIPTDVQPLSGETDAHKISTDISPPRLSASAPSPALAVGSL